MSSTSALIGAVISAWMPEDENPNAPGPKYRPVFVMDYDPKQNRLLIAKGTSQRVKQKGQGEITFTSQEINGLTKDTKFKLKHALWVPLKNEYFCGKSSGLSVLGMLPDNRKREVLFALEEAKLID